MRNFLRLLVLLLFVSCSSSSNTKVGEFIINTINGEVIDSSILSDKILVINLWATWCGPCVSEIPKLNALKEKYINDDRVVFIAISDESENRIKRFLTKKPFLYIQIANKDLSDELQSGFVNSIPKHIVLDQNREIRAYIDGAPNDIIDQLSFTIDELLK